MEASGTEVILSIFALLIVATVLGQVAVLLRQPRVIGEIAGGILLGPDVLGSLFPGNFVSELGSVNGRAAQGVLDVLYNIGLVCLMFMAGASTQAFFNKRDRRATLYLLVIGTAVPFGVTFLTSQMLPLEGLTGPADSRTGVALVLAAAATVVSVPVITRIFRDIGILESRFATLILGVAVLEDFALWAVVAAAVALAKPAGNAGSAPPVAVVGASISASGVMLIAGSLVVPPLLRIVGRSRFGRVFVQAPLLSLATVAALFVAAAITFNVTIVFAAFLAGFAFNGGFSPPGQRFTAALGSLDRVAGALLIPFCFALIGYRISFSQNFSWTITLGFLVGSSLLVILSAAAAGFLAGFRGMDLFSIAITRNARGGPGIVLAAVAYDAGIINGVFFTALVLTALATSTVAGAWLDLIVRRGWSLLEENPQAQTADV
jgi:K+:H+ antiporter